MAPLRTAECCFLNKLFGSVKKIISPSISPCTMTKDHQNNKHTDWYVFSAQQMMELIIPREYLQKKKLPLRWAGKGRQPEPI